MRSRAALLWWALPVLAVIELVGQRVIAAGLVPRSDWLDAGEHVRSHWEEGDLVLSAPAWTDPLLREAMRDRIDAHQSGHSDLAGVRRLWQISIRDARAPEAPDRAPDETVRFGKVRVDRWTLDEEVVHYDLTSRVLDASVSLVENGIERPCTVRHDARTASTAGLAGGPFEPNDRHVCDPRRPWLWVGRTVQEDLALVNRDCVWQHPAGIEPVRARYADVPLGDRIVIHADIWWEHERSLDGGPVSITVRVNGRELGVLEHRDGDGWERLELAMPPELRGQRGTIELDVTAPMPHIRSLCWAASTRGPAPDGDR